MKLPDLQIGDMIRVGKFLNKKAEIKDFGTDKHGQPTVKTNKGEHRIFKFRLEKLMVGSSIVSKWRK